MPQEELDLFQLASRCMTEPGTGTSQIVRRQLRPSDALGGFLHNVPNRLHRHAISPCPSNFVDSAEKLPSINCGCGEPIVEFGSHPVGNWNRSNVTLMDEGDKVREFYSELPRPALVGIEATGSMQWFLNLMEELGIECRVGHPAQIRAAEPRKQKHDRRDADLILKLLAENRFPAIWLPSKELLDLRALLLHRHQWVRMRVRMQNALQAIALANGLRRGPALWSYDGQAKIAFLPLLPHAAYRRRALQAMYKTMESEIESLNKQVA